MKPLFHKATLEARQEKYSDLLHAEICMAIVHKGGQFFGPAINLAEPLSIKCGCHGLVGLKMGQEEVWRDGKAWHCILHKANLH